MELLKEYIQDIVIKYFYENETYDDSKKKWLYRYFEIEHLDNKDCSSIDKNLELFLDTLEELKTNDTQFLIDMAIICGHNCLLSDSKIEELIAKANELRETVIAQMEAEIMGNEDAILKEKERYDKENALLSNLNSVIQDVQKKEAELIKDAEQNAFDKIKQHWNQEHAALENSVNQVIAKEAAISDLKSETTNLKEKTNEKKHTVFHFKLMSYKIIHLILLISLTFFCSLAAFWFFQTEGIAWVLTVLNVVFAIFILLTAEDEVYVHKCYKIFFSTLIPILLMSCEVSFIEYAKTKSYFSLLSDHHDAPFLFSCLFSILTFYASFLLYNYINETGEGDSRATSHHNELLIILALIVSIVEFFSFEDGWGYGFISLAANMYFAYIRVKDIEQIHKKKCPRYEDWFSLIYFAFLTTLAYLTDDLGKIILIPFSIGISAFAKYLSSRIKKIIDMIW